MAFGPAQNLSTLKVQVDRLSSAKGRALSQELCLWGSISPRNSIKWPRSMDLLSLTRGMTAAKLPRHRPRCGAMSEITNTFNAAKISDGDVKGSSVEISIRRFCGSLARRLHPWRKTRAEDEVAPTNASAQTGSPIQLPINRIIKHGRFDWGSFSAFEDGSIEVEIAGVKQWFRNFSELEGGLRSRGRR